MPEFPVTVLFDLDGTLVDTAPDLGYALNRTLEYEGLPALAADIIRPHVSNGANALVTLGFGTTPEQSVHQPRLARLLDYYNQHIADNSRLFQNMDRVLACLEQMRIPWGVVTNKPRYLSERLLQGLNLDQRCAVLVCPDDVSERKPHPEGLLLACRQLQVNPVEGLYVGDHQRDIEAGQRAGMKTAAALFGYIAATEDTRQWQADYYLEQPQDLIQYLELQA